MKKLKIYLNTTVYSALYDKIDIIRQDQTKEFWDNIKTSELYFSDINVEEINGVTDQHLKNNLRDLLKNRQEIEISTEARQLAKVY